MSTTSFTPKDIKTAKAKYPNEPLLKLEIKKTRVNKNKQQPTYYIPFVMKNVAGKYAPLYLKFVKQVIASSAKIPHGVEEDQAKDVRIAYRRLTEADLAQSEYEESKREILLKSNEELIDAFNIIAEEYFSLVKREVMTYKGEMFKLQKNRTINCFRQDKRKAGDGEEGDDDGMIDLPVPIYRVKLEADLETGKIGKATEKGHRYIVFDMRKTTRQAAENTKKGIKTQPKPVIAKISVQGKQTDLTLKNAKHFITYMSLTGGTIHFDSICISKSGISILCKFTDLHVLHHKVVKKSGLNAEDIAEFAGFGNTSTEDDLDVVLDEPEDEESKTNKSKKGKNSKLYKALDNDEDGEQLLDDEPVENDGGDDEETNQQVDDTDDAPVKQTKKGKKSGSDEESDEEPKKGKKTEDLKKTKKLSDTEVEEPKKGKKTEDLKKTKKAVEESEVEENVETNENEETEENVETNENEETEENVETNENEETENNSGAVTEVNDNKETENNSDDVMENNDNEEPAKKTTKSESKSKASKPEAKGASLKAGARKK